jgi:hypothetical protein
MNSGENDCPEKINLLFQVFKNFKGGRSGKSIIIVDKFDRFIHSYPPKKQINFNKADILYIRSTRSID